MACELSLHVILPDKSSSQIIVRDTDTPRVIAASAVSTDGPVMFLHKGACLCPYLSLGAQRVVSGDRIVLHSVDMPKSQQKGWYWTTVRRSNVMREILKLADIGFYPYETGLCGALQYQQMAREACRPVWESVEEEPTELGVPSESVSTDKLPVCWKEKPTTVRHLRKRAMPHKRKPEQRSQRSANVYEVK